MRMFTCLAIVGALAAGSAVAKEAPSAESAAKDAVVTTSARGGKTLYVCEDTAMTRRAFAREFGQVQFVTADDVRAGEETWAAPRCITNLEAKRLKVKRLASAR